MAGYAYSVRFRAVDPDGNSTTYDLTALAVTRGPVETSPSYEPELTQRTTPNYQIIERRFGTRPTVEMRFEVANLPDEATLAAIFNAAITDDWHVFLSLDGGTTEREVIASDSYVREPLAGKTVGFSITLALRAVDVIAAIPPINPSGVTQW